MFDEYLKSIYPKIQQDEDKKVEKDWLAKAKAGNANAQYMLGLYYRDSKRDENDKLSVYWLTKAADNHNSKAMNNLGIAYSQGIFVKKDLSQAVEWYQKGANGGDQVAMFNLGLHYFFGSGIKKSYKEAFYWLEKASFKDEPHAQFMLAKMYLTSAGIENSKDMGTKWLSLVAYRYYNSYFVADVTKRDQYINTFILFQIARFSKSKPKYQKGTSKEMVKIAKELSGRLEKACSLNSYNNTYL